MSDKKNTGTEEKGNNGDMNQDGIEINRLNIDELDEDAGEENTAGEAAEENSADTVTVSDFSTEELQELLQAKQKLEEQSAELERKEALLAEYEDLLKRKQAEFENYRKRGEKEAQDFKRYANVEIVLDVLNTIDDFERAIESTKSSRDFDALVDGIMLVEKQLKTVLENKYSVKVIEAVGKEFDPTVHDAIMMEESENHDEDTVIEDFQKGYIMHDRVIRPAKVKVAKAVSSEYDNGSGDDERKSSEEGV
jgi:molecular chaperone GrpE